MIPTLSLSNAIARFPAHSPESSASPIARLENDIRARRRASAARRRRPSPPPPPMRSRVFHTCSLRVSSHGVRVTIARLYLSTARVAASSSTSRRRPSRRHRARRRASSRRSSRRLVRARVRARGVHERVVKIENIARVGGGVIVIAMRSRARAVVLAVASDTSKTRRVGSPSTYLNRVKWYMYVFRVGRLHNVSHQ